MSSGYFDDLVGPLKRAAIDAWMVSEGWYLPGTEGYGYTDGNIDGGDQVSRPSKNGEGGGDWTSNKLREWLWDDDEYYMSQFDDIRSAIDNALKRWRDIPKGSKLRKPIQRMVDANVTLALSVDEGGTVSGAGSIAGNLGRIDEASDEMSGGMISTFQSEFLSQLGKAIAGQHAITTILGGHLAGQEKMWDGARASVIDIIESATESFDAAARGHDVDWKAVLKVAGYAVTGASIFASGGATIALGVAGLGLTILNDTLPDGEKAPKGEKSEQAPTADYSSVLEAFKGDLEALDSSITKEEEEIDLNLSNNLEAIRRHSGSFDLTRPSLLTVDDDKDLGRNDKGDYEEIRLDPVLTKAIAGTYMPSIANALYAAQEDVDGAADTSALVRDDSIGIGEWGPSPKWGELRWLLWELLGNLAWEIKNSAKTLELAVEDIGQADTSSKDALEKHADDLAGKGTGTSGGPDDPWNLPPTHGV